MARTAEFLREAEGFHGAAAIYKLTPAYSAPQGLVRYVVASAVDLTPVSIPGYRTSETMVFPCNRHGNDIHFRELVMVPNRSHVDALAQLGYVID